MSELYNNLLIIKNAISDIQTSLKNFGINYKGKGIKEYSKLVDDIYQLIINENRVDYSYAFVNWNATNILPSSEINAKLVNYMFMNCINITDMSNVIINITADKPNVISYCMGCLQMTVPPTINFVNENAHVVRSYVCAYANCRKLTTAKIWFGDGSQSAAGERTDMANCFLNCGEITSIVFDGQGSPKNLDLSPCVKLEIDSIESLYNALMDVSGLNGTYTISLSSTTNELINEDLKSNFKSKGWTIQIKEVATT